MLLEGSEELTVRLTIRSDELGVPMASQIASWPSSAGLGRQWLSVGSIHPGPTSTFSRFEPRWKARRFMIALRWSYSGEYLKATGSTYLEWVFFTLAIEVVDKLGVERVKAIGGIHLII